MALPKIGFSIGDINGIGLEVLIKALSNPMIFNQMIPVIYGSSKVFSYHKNIVSKREMPLHIIRQGESIHHDKINIVNCWDENVNIVTGEINSTGGHYAAKSLEIAVQELKQHEIDALVTAPIHKKAMDLANFGFPGHTEYLSSKFNVDDHLMVLVNEKLRVGVVTGHIPIADVSKLLTTEKIINKAKIFLKSLSMDFGIEAPKLALLGLNPHAGDNGLFGDEEETKIKPAIAALKKEGHLVMGPYSADGFFGSGKYQLFDGVLAMYHDQGLIPFKTIAFDSGVNFTAGLPIVRTSPDHGTGFEIAGKNEASAESMRKAIYLAIDLFKTRTEYEYYQANKLVKHELEEEAENASKAQLIEDEI